MRYFALAIVTTFCFGSAFCQVSQGLDSQNNLNLLGTGQLGSVVRQMKPSYEGIKGNPLYAESFQDGSITMEDGNRYAPVRLNLDLIDNEVLVLKDGSTVPWVISKPKIKSLTVNFRKDSVIHIVKMDLPKSPECFCELIATNEQSEILLKRTKKVRKADNSGAYSRGVGYDEIYEEYQYYLRNKTNNDIFPISLRKKKLNELFPERQEKINRYLEAYETDLKKHSEIVAFFRAIL